MIQRGTKVQSRQSSKINDFQCKLKGTHLYIILPYNSYMELITFACIYWILLKLLTMSCDSVLSVASIGSMIQIPQSSYYYNYSAFLATFEKNDVHIFRLSNLSMGRLFTRKELTIVAN